MKKLLLILLLLKSVFSFCQDFNYPTILKEGKNIQDFLPLNWDILNSVNGDLNNDGKDDIAFVLQYKDSVTIRNYKNGENAEDTLITTKPRILGIAFKNQENNNFRIAEQSNTFILCHDNPSYLDPFTRIRIENGILIIDFHLHYIEGGWWFINSTFKFWYRNNDFFLIGIDSHSESMVPEEGEEYSINFLTRKYELNGFKSDFDLKELKTFKTFSRPLQFTWRLNNEISL